MTVPIITRSTTDKTAISIIAQFGRELFDSEDKHVLAYKDIFDTC